MPGTSGTGRLGWIGTGRMGLELCRRLLAGGCDLAIYNRSRDKAAPLVDRGAALVDSPIDLADRDVVFTMVADPEAFLAVTLGDGGLLTGATGPAVLVDSSTISGDASEEVRTRAEKLGTAVVAAPVSGNPKVVASGKLTVVASGPRPAYDLAEPYLQMYGSGVTYVGEGDVARAVKLCHNMMLGVTTQILAEITVLAERAGVSRADFLEFINRSVMGSVFSRYKTPAFVNLDFEPTFTTRLLRKDLDLGLALGRELEVPLPVTALVHEILSDLVGHGFGERDFAALLTREAAGAGVTLASEGRQVSDGLEPESA